MKKSQILAIVRKKVFFLTFLKSARKLYAAFLNIFVLFAIKKQFYRIKKLILIMKIK